MIQSQPMTGDIVFASRSGETPIVGYRKTWLRIAKSGDFAGGYHAPCAAPQLCRLAVDLGCNEPTIASLFGHKTHSITSSYVHSVGAVATGSSQCRDETPP